MEVQEGEIVALIGRNGSGKSTLLKILSRVTHPTAGRATVDGRVSAMLEVGTGFHPDLTGRENVFLNGTILGMRRAEVARKFDDIVDFAGVSEFLDTPVKRYSSGMIVRLGFAVAAHLEGEILLVDEVLAVGDAEFQRRCLGKLEDVSGQGRTIVFVSHNMAVVRRLCHRAYLLDGGRIAATGSTSDVIAEYMSIAGAAQDGGVAYLGPNVNRVGTGHARVTRVALLDQGTNTQVNQVRIGQPIAISVTVEALEHVPDAAVEVGIGIADGVRVVTTQSVNGHAAGADWRPGTYEARVELDAALLPGDYVIDVAIRALRGIPLDYVERVLQFSVINLGMTEEDHLPWAVPWSGVRAASRWQFSEETSLELARAAPSGG
jgi:lipopolysaccharide transport system ATP-binding protein